MSLRQLAVWYDLLNRVRAWPCGRAVISQTHGDQYQNGRESDQQSPTHRDPLPPFSNLTVIVAELVSNAQTLEKHAFPPTYQPV